MMNRIKFAAFAFAVFAIDGATAQVAVPPPLVPLGYCQLTSIDTAVLISTCSGGIPSGANVAILIPEAQTIRYRDDGTSPSATVGQPVAVAASVVYAGSLTAVRVISQTAGAKLNILFYKSP